MITSFWKKKLFFYSVVTTWEKQISTMKTFVFVGFLPCLLLDVGLCVGNFDNESFLAHIFFINSTFNYANLYEQKTLSKHQKIPLLHLLPPLFLCQIYRCKCWHLPLTPLLKSDKFLQIPFPVSCQSYRPEKRLVLSVFPGHLTSLQNLFCFFKTNVMEEIMLFRVKGQRVRDIFYFLVKLGTAL